MMAIVTALRPFNNSLAHKRHTSYITCKKNKKENRAMSLNFAIPLTLLIISQRALIEALRVVLLSEAVLMIIARGNSRIKTCNL